MSDQLDMLAAPRGSAIFSDDGFYRYRLERDLGRDGPTVAILGVNPSLAGAEVDDQTIRKDVGFGERFGWGRLIKGNKFGHVAKDVKELRACKDPVGPDNDAHLEQIMRDSDVHVMAWGPLTKLPPHLRNRWKAVVAIADRVGCKLMCLTTAKDGHPRHTLMLAYATPLIPWVRP
jgi:hypothetical protein